MRDYGRVSPRFWTGKTGKALRGNVQSQLLALYLMTSPHSNMIGVFHCPVMYMAHETGMTIEGASEALQSLIEADFCTFDGDEEMVWVHEMAAHQVGESLSANDKQVIGIRRQYEQIHSTLIQSGFADRYSVAYHLKSDIPEASPLEAPSKPGTGEGTGIGTGKGEKQTPPAKPAATSKRGSRLPDDWALPKPWGEWALAARKTWTPEFVRQIGEKFRDHWHAQAGTKGVKADWQATWRNWVRNESDPKGGMPDSTAREDRTCVCCDVDGSRKEGTEWFCSSHDRHSPRKTDLRRAA